MTFFKILRAAIFENKIRIIVAQTLQNRGWLSRVMNATTVSQNVDEMLSSEKNNDSDDAER